MNEIWIVIAEAFETKPGDRTKAQREVAEKGICQAACVLRDRTQIDFAQCGTVMLRAGRGALEVKHMIGPVAYLAETQTSKGDRIRAKFCREQVG